MGSTETAEDSFMELVQRSISTVGDTRQLFGCIPIHVRPGGVIIVHPRLVEVLREVCKDAGHDYVAANNAVIHVSDEAPLPTALATYGCEGKDGLEWRPPVSTSESNPVSPSYPIPTRKAEIPTRKASTGELDIYLCVESLITRLESLVPIDPPNMDTECTISMPVIHLL